MTTIKVLDALCGTGKSTAIFNLMRNSPEKKWIYVSPLKTEVMNTTITIKKVVTEVQGRIQKELPELNFKSPEGNSKTTEVLKLLEDGDNISCTHELFKRMDWRHWRLLKDQKYNVVLDEEVTPVEWFDCNEGNVNYMLRKNEVAIEGPFSQIVLKGDLQELLQTDMKEIAEAASQGILFTAKNPKQVEFLTTHLPIELFEAAEHTIILTYLFSGSILDNFLKLHGLEWEYLHLPLWKTNAEVIEKLKGLINFKTNASFDALSRKTFSHTNYQKMTKKELNAVGNAYWTVARVTPDDKLITTMPKVNAHKGNRYVGTEKMRNVKNSWLWSGTRATNDHAEKNVVVYMINKYPPQATNVYFSTHGLPIDDDHFALSEMLQFLFRSALRKGEKIDLYIPSTRMKKLLEDWLQQEEQHLLEDYA